MSATRTSEMKLLHGTSTARWEKIRREGLGGRAGPYLTDNVDIAQYYAEEVASEDGSEPVVIEVIVRDLSKLRYDRAAMDEPVMVPMSEVCRVWRIAAKRHPEWVGPHGTISIPDRRYKISLKTVHSVRYEGVVPARDLREVP